MWRSWAHSQFSHVENIKSRCASQINSCEHLRNNAISKQFCIHYSRVEINRKYFLTFFLKNFCLRIYLFQLCVYMHGEVAVMCAMFSETRRRWWQTPWSWNSRWCECWEPNLGTQQEQPVFFMAETSLQSITFLRNSEVYLPNINQNMWITDYKQVHLVNCKILTKLAYTKIIWDYTINISFVAECRRGFLF